MIKNPAIANNIIATNFSNKYEKSSNKIDPAKIIILVITLKIPM